MPGLGLLAPVAELWGLPFPPCQWFPFSPRAVLLPLLDLPPPTKPLLIVVDALDAAKRDRQEEQEEEEERGPTPGPSKSIAQLLGSHLRLLPPWLLLVCSARSHSQGVLRLFPGEQGPWGGGGEKLLPQSSCSCPGPPSRHSFPWRR